MMVILMSLPFTAGANEIAPFRFTDADGLLALRYFFDEYTTSSEGEVASKEKNPTFQQELAVNSYAYVYHPNMLNINMGGSLLYDQSDFETLDGETSTDSQRTNYFAFLDFLEKKPYPFTLYYDKQNPSVSTGRSGRYIQENTKYGFDFSLLEPFSPIQINLGAFRRTSVGEGQDQVVDDIQDQSFVRFYHAYGKGNHAQLSHQVNQFESRSGNPTLTIEERIYETKSTILDTRNLFGATRQIQLTNNISYNTQDLRPFIEDLRINPNLNWQHSDYVNSYYRLDFSEISEEDQETINRRLSLGVSRSDEIFNSGLEVHGENNESTGFEFQNYGSIISLGYARPTTGNGKLQLSYRGNYDRNDQQTEVSQLRVIREDHTFTGITAVTLVERFIDVNTIVVKNDTDQVLDEGIDYRIIVIGSRVQIERFTTEDGRIKDGDTIRVAYSYETGGTYQYSLVSNNVNLSWGFARYYNLYLRYFESRQQLEQGNPTVPLNTINRSTIELNAEGPLTHGITVGGQASYENNNEDISPYVKENYDAFMELPLPRLTDVRLSVRRLKVDNETSEEDVDLNGYILHINSQPWLRTSLSLDSSYEKDTGGSLERLLRSHRFTANWRLRQLTVSLNATYSVEEQGSFERERWSVMFITKREF